MIVQLDEEHTKCSICITEFSCDRDSQDPDIRLHLPVLSSSQRCDHWFCHGCILREQQRVAEENNGKIPKWIRCMHCREKTSFNPAEPMYHRLLIDLLARAQKHAVDHVNMKERGEMSATSVRRSAINYVTTIKNCFHAYPRIYHKFSEMLSALRKGEQDLMDVLDEVPVLFAGHADLIEGYIEVQSLAKAQLLTKRRGIKGEHVLA